MSVVFGTNLTLHNGVHVGYYVETGVAGVTNLVLLVLIGYQLLLERWVQTEVGWMRYYGHRVNLLIVGLLIARNVDIQCVFGIYSNPTTNVISYNTAVLLVANALMFFNSTFQINFSLLGDYSGWLSPKVVAQASTLLVVGSWLAGNILAIVPFKWDYSLIPALWYTWIVLIAVLIEVQTYWTTRLLRQNFVQHASNMKKMNHEEDGPNEAILAGAVVKINRFHRITLFACVFSAIFGCYFSVSKYQQWRQPSNGLPSPSQYSAGSQVFYLAIHIPGGVFSVLMAWLPFQGGLTKAQIRLRTVGVGDQNSPDRPNFDALDVGLRVVAHTKRGIKGAVLLYKGRLRTKDGLWFGLQLDLPHGKNNGVLEGEKYFECPPNYGMFVRPRHVQNAADYVLIGEDVDGDAGASVLAPPLTLRARDPEQSRGSSVHAEFPDFPQLSLMLSSDRSYTSDAVLRIDEDPEHNS